MELKILKQEETPENVIEHSKAVCKKAMKIAANFKDADKNLIKKGALLHDIGRSKTHGITHAVEGAKIVREYGYPEEVQNIVERHIGAGLSEDEAIKLGLPKKSYIPQTIEEKIVAHADNLISGTKEVDVDFDIAKWKRKIDEALLATELEVHYSKNEILEGYLNTINYGGVFGIEEASKYYFGKSSKDLSLAEASLLAGIPQSPNNYSPVKNYNLSKERQKIVLTMMKKNKVISEEEYQKALNENITIVGKSKESNIASVNYFKDSVLEELKSLKQIPSNIIETGGLKIYTTLDSEAQENLENSVQKYINNEQELETSAIMMNPDTGGIMALIGGNNYNKSQYNRATNSKRQIGSTMKPILYYTALESGFTPSSSFTSEKTTFTFSEGKTYSPKNYNDKYAEGPISMAAAISYSDNIYAVKTHLFLGEDMLINTAKRIGITSKLTPIPSLALGTEEMSLMEITAAYSSFANQGYKINPHFIKKVEDSKGNTLYENKEEKIEVLNSSLTYILNEMLTYTYNKNFIDYNYPTLISLLPNITHKYAIKSGTTDTDLLIMGYNKNAVLGVWTGYDDNKKIDSTKYSYHKNIWIDTMESYFKNHEAQWYDIPDNVVGVLVNPITGTLIDDNAEKKEMFFYIKGTEPTTNNETKDLEAVFKEEQKSKLEE